MRTEIRQLHNKLQTTTVYVTHDQIEAMTMADKIVVMRAGNIEQIGTPDAVYDRPNSKCVADFIGSSAINFLNGTVVTGAGGPAVDTASGQIALPAGTTASAGQKVICGVRPNDVTIAETGAIATTAVLIERMGHEAQLCAKSADGDFYAIVDKAARFSEGAPVRFKLAPEKVHVFDAGTERGL